MFPYNHTYDPFSPSRYGYEGPSYGGRSDSHYLQALAEEEAARRQYAQALREQESARNRAARARLARQTYENPFYDAYLGDEDDYGFGYPSQRSSFPGSYLSPQEQRALLLERQQQEQQRRLELLEREREKERQRIKALEEERRRQLLLEEERRRRIMLEEEERQRKREMMRRRREEEDFLRRNASQEEAFSPLDELLGLRPRFMQPQTQSTTRRARTTSPNHRTRAAEGAQNPQRKTPASPTQSTSQTPRTPSRSPQPGRTSIPINSPRPEARKPSPPPRQYTPEEVSAAEKIQEFWRTYHQRRTALASIAEAAARFEDIKSHFALPAVLDYTFEGQQVSVPTVAVDVSPASELARTEKDAKLAYTPNNTPVHVYEEGLNRILTKLDGVQSGGDQEVRNKRRELVRRVEMEAERIENVKILVWRAWVSRPKDTQDSEMQVEESVPEPSSQSAPEPVDVLPTEQMAVDNATLSPATCETDAPTERVDTLPDAMEVDSAPEVEEETTEVSEEPCPDIVIEEPSSDTGDDSSDVTEVVVEEHQPGLTAVTTSFPDDNSDVEQSPVSEPTLVYSPSDGDVTPPRTPPAVHEHLDDTSAEVRKEPTAQARPLSATERLQLLRPLFNREWEEEFDFF